MDKDNLRIDFKLQEKKYIFYTLLQGVITTGEDNSVCGAYRALILLFDVFHILVPYGRYSGMIFDTGYFNDDPDFYDSFFIFDRNSRTDIVNPALKRIKEIKRLLVIDRLYIAPEFRNNRFGEEVIRQIEKREKKQYDIEAIQPYYYEGEPVIENNLVESWPSFANEEECLKFEKRADKKKADAAIRKYYQSCGFHDIPENTYMYKKK